MSRASLVVLLIGSLGCNCVCTAADVLFAKATRNYDHDGVVGEAYRREFETRMFTHNTWRERLYCETANMRANETIEIYTKPDGSRWLAFCRAEPALSPLLKQYALPRQRSELAKKLDRAKIVSREVVLSRDLAANLELLWNTMLPGVDIAPFPRAFPVHAPAFIAFAREGNSVKSGKICLAAYDGEAYRLFVSIVRDLKSASNEDADHKPVSLSDLRSKVKSLTARLQR